MKVVFLITLLLAASVACLGQEAEGEAVPSVEEVPAPPQVEEGLQTPGEGTNTETVALEEEAINPEGFSAAEWGALKDGMVEHEFQAEVNRLMDIIINSLYSHREVFLRELISNASDALDKIRYAALTDKSVLAAKPDLEVRIKFDKERRTVTITDSGVGMTKKELIANLGVVASSGTTEFLAAAAEGGDALQLIGQFGVGFYSVYLVCDEVTVVSKNNNDEQYVWRSTADKTYSIAKDPRGDTLGRGTEITLHLKEDAQEFVDQNKLEELIKRYSEFIQFPIFLHSSRQETREIPEEEPEEKEEEKEKEEEEAKEEAEGEAKDEDDLDVEDEEEEKKEEEKKKPKTETVTVWEWKQVNENKAIWTRAAKDVTKEEYNEFYKLVSKDYQEPLAHLHFAAEGEIAFKSVLFVPKTAPFDLYDKYYDKSQGLKLYVRKVLVADQFDEFLPRYLSFVKGVVDSDDLPLNVSRETLSKSRVLKVIAKKITKKILDLLKKLARESEEEEKEEKEEEKKDEEGAEGEGEGEGEDKKENKYATFWKQFGKSIKLGLIEDHKNRNKLTKLLRFKSSALTKDDEFTSLQAYVDRMKEDQEFIYFIAGSSIDEVKHSPFVEMLAREGFEVLYLVDPLDEYVVQNIPEFDGKKLMSVTKEGLKFGDKLDKKLEKKQKRMEKKFDRLTTWLKELYGDKVEKVTVSTRLTDSPCALVTSQFGWSANMERIMKAQTFGDADRMKYMMARKTMEINPRHPIIRSLREKVSIDNDDAGVKNIANLMYDAALFRSGFTLEDTKDFATRIHTLVATGLNVNLEEEVEEEEEEEDEDEEDEEEEDEEEEESEAVEEEPEAVEEEPEAKATETHDEL